jgi:hypothetical protein
MKIATMGFLVISDRDTNMSGLSKRILFWTPRLLAIAYIVFISLFALDVFGEGYGFWGTILALMIHLIPTLVLVAALILAWRWEWIGAALYAAAGMGYIIMILPRRISAAVKFNWILTIAGPAFFVAAMFLVDWLNRSELHSKRG